MNNALADINLKTMFKPGGSIGFIIVILLCWESEAEDALPNRDPSNLRLMVWPYPHFRTPEPYTYPGPSPAVKLPQKFSEPYPFIPPRAISNLEFDHLPKWCKSMWERDECGMKCWMLRKICRNIAMQAAADDAETSPSISHPMFNAVPYYSHYRKPVQSVSYTKTNMPNMYYAQPSWQYSYLKRSPYYRYPIPTPNTEIGLNPQFTYVDEQKKINTETTEKNQESTTTESTTLSPLTTTTTEKPENSTSGTEMTTKPMRIKGTYPVKVTTIYRYPMDSEVTTLSPHMFDYDQYGNKGYYGDRIYMSAMMPVSDRQRRDDSNSEEYDDFDEMMFDP